jgi:nucleoside-diphosphate-sugar epimerase
MKVFVAGATGAIGRPLLPQLVAAGHEVTAATRHASRTGALKAAGAEPVVCDMFDRDHVRQVLRDARPDVVVDQLTSLPERYDIRRKDLYDANNRVRREGTDALFTAAREVGARRYVVQSVAFLYAPDGNGLRTEDDPPALDAPDPFGEAVRVLVDNERKVTTADDIEGVVLRYGFFYGPGTHHAGDGDIARRVRRRMFPLIGAGAGVSSFIHVSDAASATVLAVDGGEPGIYNIVDDEPAAAGDWLPIYAQALGARRPRRVPTWLARLAAGPLAVALTSLAGASNAKAHDTLGWKPALPTWRQGFTTHLDSYVD